MSKHEWKWNWQQVDGEADCGIFYEEHPGMAYSVCRAPRCATKEQWEATATLICKAVNCHSDLLAAIRGAQSFVQAYAPIDYQDQTCKNTCLAMIDAAIKKAREQ